MLLAPFSPADTRPPRRRHATRVPHAAAETTHLPAWLLAWAVIGTLAVLFVPALRGGGFAGASVPFWLVAAPLIDLAWLAHWRRRR